MTANLNKKLADAFLLSAFGDAWGFEYEFLDFAEIVAAGAEVPSLLMVSDDTQMGIATFEATAALVNMGVSGLSDEMIREVYAEEYLKWYVDPDNNRAPGTTCMSALGRIAKFEHNPGSPAANDSLGCGTVMRTPVIGMFEDLSEADVFRLAFLASQVTHGHTGGCFVGGIVAVLVRRLASLDVKPTGSQVIDIAQSVVRDYAGVFPRTEVTLGSFTGKLLSTLDSIRVLWKHRVGMPNVCSFVGEGWTADSCLLCSLLVTLMALDSPTGAGDHCDLIRPAILTSGDTDSIACVAGWLIGAILPVSEESKDYIMGHLESRYRDWFEYHLVSVVE